MRNKKKDYLVQTKVYHNKKYKQKGLNFQRKHPNEDIIRFESKFLKRKSFVLDIGCGTGRNLLYLIKKKHTVHGIDFSIEALDLLKKILKKEKLTTRDSRVVERKKYGHRKARRSFQFSKR